MHARIRTRLITATSLILVPLVLAGCQQPSTPPTSDTVTADAATPPAGPVASNPALTPPVDVPVDPPKPQPQTNLTPPAPGEPGGLPDDRTPLNEGPIDPKSGQGAAQQVERYASLLNQGKYGEAFELWSNGGKASGMSRQAFIDSFAKYSEVHAMVGAPFDMEGAAGSSYVKVPLQLYGRLKAGGTFNMIGPVTLRRVNDVPGATPEQLQWHITKADLKAAGKVKETPAG